MERAADGSVTFWICVGFREYLDLLRGIAEDLAFKVTAFLPALAAFFPVLAAFLPLLRSDTHILSGMAAESYAQREFLVKAHPNILEDIDAGLLCFPPRGCGYQALDRDCCRVWLASCVSSF